MSLDQAAWLAGLENDAAVLDLDRAGSTVWALIGDRDRADAVDAIQALAQIQLLLQAQAAMVAATAGGAAAAGAAG